MHLISAHEIGGDDDQNLLKDADSLSFVENNGSNFISKLDTLGYDRIREKFDWMFDRITDTKAKELAKPFYEKMISELDAAGSTNMKKITYVDEKDRIIGSGTKEEAWNTGKIHRISRVLIFNQLGELLIQKRSAKLASAPGKWNESAAGHVDEGETYLEAASRELKEEVGIGDIKLQKVTKFFSNETDEDDKVKKRFNMVYKAKYNGEVRFDRNEVSEISWIKPSDLEDWIKKQPHDLTDGFIKSYLAYKEWLNDKKPKSD